MGTRQSSNESIGVETLTPSSSSPPSLHRLSASSSRTRTASPSDVHRLLFAHALPSGSPSPSSRHRYTMSAGRRRAVPSASNRSRSLFAATVYTGSADSGIGGSLDAAAAAAGVDRRMRPFSFEPASLPNMYLGDAKCPVCSKTFGDGDQMEAHLASCLSRPYITYNEDSPLTDLGECVICFDDMTAGCTIARLPCLCVYHKNCIDRWFRVNRSCPEHPL